MFPFHSSLHTLFVTFNASRPPSSYLVSDSPTVFTANKHLLTSPQSHTQPQNAVPTPEPPRWLPWPGCHCRVRSCSIVSVSISSRHRAALISNVAPMSALPASPRSSLLPPKSWLLFMMPKRRRLSFTSQHHPMLRSQLRQLRAFIRFPPPPPSLTLIRFTLQALRVPVVLPRLSRPLSRTRPLLPRLVALSSQPSIYNVPRDLRGHMLTWEQTALVTVTLHNGPTLTSSSSLLAFIVENGTTFWYGGQTPTKSYNVQTSVVTIVPVDTHHTSTLTLQSTVYTTHPHTVTATLSASSHTVSGEHVPSHGTGPALTSTSWGGWNVTSTAGGVFVRIEEPCVLFAIVPLRFVTSPNYLD